MLFIVCLKLMINFHRRHDHDISFSANQVIDSGYGIANLCKDKSYGPSKRKIVDSAIASALEIYKQF